MNIHPIFVHFPVALLTLYALFEIARFKKLEAWPAWRPMKAVFLLFGVFGAIAAYLSGDLIEGQFESMPATAKLVDVHSTFASITVAVFGTAAVLYLVLLLDGNVLPKSLTWLEPVRAFLRRLAHVFETRWSILIGVIGLIAITITGTLGGALAYGPTIDPFVGFVYRLLVGA